MKKRQGLTVMGTRPEIIRLSCVIQKLDASEAIEPVSYTHLDVYKRQVTDFKIFLICLYQ